MLNLHHTARVFLAVQLDRRIPVWLKVSAWSGMVYVFSPLDVLPELFTGIGLLDDIIFSLIIMQTFLETAPRNVVDEHCARLGIAPEQIFISVPQTIREARSLYVFAREFGASFREGFATTRESCASEADEAAAEGSAPPAARPAPAGSRYSALRNGAKSTQEPR